MKCRPRDALIITSGGNHVVQTNVGNPPFCVWVCLNKNTSNPAGRQPPSRPLWSGLSIHCRRSMRASFAALHVYTVNRGISRTPRRLETADSFFLFFFKKTIEKCRRHFLRCAVAALQPQPKGELKKSVQVAWLAGLTLPFISVAFLLLALTSPGTWGVSLFCDSATALRLEFRARRAFSAQRLA